MTPYSHGELADLDVESGSTVFRVHGFISAVDEAVLQLTQTSAQLDPLPRTGARVQLHVVRGDGVYSAETRLIELLAPTELLLEQPQQVRRIQRRAAFRVPCSIPVQFALVDPPHSLLAGTTDGKACVHDLSAEGIRLSTRGAVPVGSNVVLELDLGEPPPMVLTARLVRVEELPGERWQMSGPFVGLTTAMESRLSRFVLQRERRSRHRSR